MIRLAFTILSAAALIVAAVSRSAAIGADDAAASSQALPSVLPATPGDPAPAKSRVVIQPQARPAAADAPVPGAPVPAAPHGQHPAKTLGGDTIPVQTPPNSGQQRQRREGRQRMTPEMIDQLLALAKTIDPARAERLSEMRRDNLPAFQRWLGNNGRRLAGLLELEKRNPELFNARICELRAEAKVNNIAREYHRARESGRFDEASRLEAEVREAEDDRFDCSVRARGMELVILDARMEKMRAELKNDLDNRKQIVEERTATLLATPPEDDVPVPHETVDPLVPQPSEPKAPASPGN